VFCYVGYIIIGFFGSIGPILVKRFCKDEYYEKSVQNLFDGRKLELFMLQLLKYVQILTIYCLKSSINFLSEVFF
jgi:hypothetical protein